MSLAGKSRNRKSDNSKTPSSPRAIAPVGLSLSDVDDRISGHFESFSQSFDRRFELLSSNIGLLLSNVDDRISGHFESFSQSFDRRFELLSSNIFDRSTELATTMSTRVSNPPFSEEPVVPVRKPVHGQNLSLSPPVSIGSCHCQCPTIHLW